MRIFPGRHAFPALLLLVLCGCSDLLFGFGEDPGEQLLVTRGSEILRVSVGSGEVEVVHRLGTSVDGSLLSESGVLHAATELEGVRGLMGLDVCTGASVYESPVEPRVHELSHDEDELFVYEATPYFEVPEVLVLSASTGRSARTIEPLRAVEMHRIPAGPAYPDGAVILRGHRQVERPIDWPFPSPEDKFYIFDPGLTTVLDSIRGDDLEVGGIRPILPDRRGRNIYLFTGHEIVQYDLASWKPVSRIPEQVRSGIATRAVLADGRMLVTDLGFNLTPSSGDIYFISPDLQQVDTVDVGSLMGERDRATAAAVVDLDNQRAYVVSPDAGGWAGWGDPLPVRLLVLDLARKELVKVLDLGLFTRSPPLYFFPDCWGRNLSSH